MFKRLRWTLFGALLGAGGSIWARWRVKRTVERYLPEQVGRRARRRLSQASDDLRAAIEEGRVAMDEREVELRTRYAERLLAPPVERGRVIEARPRPEALPPAGRPTPSRPPPSQTRGSF